MKLLKKGVAAITAAAMMASAAVPGITGSSIFSAPAVSAAETENLDYVFSVSSETYDVSTLKTFEYYTKNNLYSTSTYPAGVQDGQYNTNKVAEVTLKLDKNAGFYVTQFILDYDESLVFAGCSVIESKVTDENPLPVSYLEGIEDSRVTVSAKLKKVIVILKDGSNVTDTGDFVKLLFILPDKAANGDSYRINLSSKTEFQIARWDGQSDINYSSVEGGITLAGDSQAEPVPSPSAPAEVSPVPSLEPVPSTTKLPEDITAPPVDAPAEVPQKLPLAELLTSFDQENQIEPAANSTFDIKTDNQMVYAGSKAEFSVKLSDFDAEKDNFGYGLLGLTLPEGFSVDSVSVNSENYSADDYLEPDSIFAQSLNNKTGFDATGGYIVLNGIDSSKFSSDEEICKITVNVPENSEKMANDIVIASAFARRNSDGKIQSFKTTSGNLYNTFVATVFSGRRGDVNLDGAVNQLDATLVLKECLALGVRGESILADNINTDAAGSLSVELSNFLGDVDASDNGEKLEQLDATTILKAILEADLKDLKEIPEDIWAKYIG